MALKYGIIGTAPSRNMAPYQDTDWLMSGQNLFYGIPRWDWWFEVHNVGFMSTNPDWQQLWQWLTGKLVIPEGTVEKVLPFPDGTKKVWMREPHPDIPGSVAYPRAEIIEFLGELSGSPEAMREMAWVLTSTVALEMALAMYEIVQARKDNLSQGGDKLGLWGVEMASETEYYLQKPGVRQLMQWARKLGIEVVTPMGCNLLSIGPIYGLDDPPHIESLVTEEVARFNKRKEEILAKVKNLDAELHVMHGGESLLDYIKKNGDGVPKIDEIARKEYTQRREQIQVEQMDLSVELQQIVGSIYAFEFCKNNWLK